MISHPAATLLLSALLLLEPLASAQSGPPAESGQKSSERIAQLEREAREIVPVVARLRELRAEHKIAMGVLTRQQIMAEIRARLAQDYSEEEVRNEEAILKRLGLLDHHTDYRQAVLRLLTDQVAGFYHPEKKQLNIARWLPLNLQKPTLAHEICHALQDQHFNLKRFVRPNRDNGDRQLARAALVEGDCTALMLEFVLEPRGIRLSSVSNALDALISGVIGGGGAKFQAAPRFLRETLTFPYVYGLRFIQHLRARSNWSAVNRAFARPPTSSEQLIHFDKFERRERVQAIDVRPVAALSDYHQLKLDTLGEFQLKLLLLQATDEAVATQAAAGWGGDRLAAYRRRDQPTRALPLIVHLSSWDSERDAVEFQRAIGQLFAKLTGSPRNRDGVGIYRDGEQQQWAIERRGNEVLLLIAVPAAIRPATQEQVWRRWRRHLS